VVVNLRNAKEGVIKMCMIILAMMCLCFSYQHSRLSLGSFMINVYLLNKISKPHFHYVKFVNVISQLNKNIVL